MNALLRNLLIAMVLVHIGFGASVIARAGLVSEVDVDQDQELELVMENAYCRLVLKPSQGKGTSLVIKPANVELLRGEQGARAGLLGDFIEQQGHSGDYLNKPFTVEVVANTDEKATVRFTRVGATDLLRWITLTKTITMYADRAALDVEYELSNEQASMEDYTLSLGISNLFHSEGDMTLTLPLSAGVLRKVLSAQVPSQSDQHYDQPARGWGSMVREGGTGVAFLVDAAQIKKFYEWHKATSRSLEWVYLAPKIEQGKSFKTAFQVIPFHGLSQVDGVVKGYAGNIEVEGVAETAKRTPVRVKLSGGSGVLPMVRISAVRLPDDKEVTLGEAAATKARDGTLSASADFAPERDGLYVIKARVMQGRETLGEFERPIQVGQARETYVLKPLTPRNTEDKTAAGRRIPMPADSSAAKKAAAPIQELPPDIQLSDAIKTEHIPWANPYYMGKTKVFFLLPSPKGREVIEMAQRLSMDYVTATHGTVGYKVPWTLMRTWSPQVAAATQKKILQTQPLDVIVSCAPWDVLDPEVQRLVMERVRNGTGLVTISPRLQKSGSAGYKYDCALTEEELKAFPVSLATAIKEDRPMPWKAVKPHFVTTGVPLELMQSEYSIHTVQNGEVVAEIDSQPLIVVGTMGKGRVVSLNYNIDNYFSRDLGLIPIWRRYLTNGKFDPNPTHPTFHWWDYAWSLLIKSTLWASGREPELLIEDIRTTDDGRGVTLQIDNHRGDAELGFDLTVRNAFSGVENHQSISRRVAKGKSSVTLPIDTGKLSGGFHLADVIIRSGDLVINWGTTVLQVAHPVTIQDVALDKVYLNPGDDIAATVTLSGPMPTDASQELWAGAYDVRGRLIVETPIAAAAETNSVPCKVSTAGIETIPFYLHVQLRSGMRVVDEKRVRGIMAQSQPWDDYIYCLEMAIGFHGYYVPDWMKQFRKAGGNMMQTRTHANSNFGEAVDSDLLLADGSRFIDDFGYNSSGAKEHEYRELKTNYTRTKDLKYLVRNPCFNNPDYRAKTLDRITKLVGYMKQFGKMDYLLTDELSMTNYGDAYDFCFCEHCRKAFREWVNPQYSSLKEVSEAYGMTFASWEEVRMVSTYEAREAGKWAGWADHRTFNEHAMHAFFAWMRDQARAIQPDATLNLSGTQTPTAYNGHDVWLRSQVFDNLWCYGYGQQTRLHRSFNPQLKQMPWGGYGSSGIDMHHKIWSNVFQGGHGNAFYWFPIYMDPDFQLSPSSQAWSDAAADLLRGAGKTLLTSQFEDYGIGIHYSQPSIHAAYVLDAASVLDADRAAWAEDVIEGSQFQARFLAYAQLERGDLTYPKVKVLVLPYSIALSDKEAEAIRQFVKSGGTVIADMQTGIMDQHCRPRSGGAIDDVLGIRRGSTEIRPVDGTGDWNLPKEWNITLGELGIQLQEPGIATTTGQALYRVNNTPGIIMNTFGKGRAWYLNFSLAKFESLRKEGRERSIVTLIDRILALADVRHFASVVDDDGQRVSSCQVFTFHRDALRFVGVLPDLPAKGASATDQSARLVVPAGYQLFDMRKGAPADPTRITLSPGIAHLYALLPYTVTELELTAPPSARPGETVEIAVKVGVNAATPGDHVIHVETRNPSGEAIYYYSKNLLSNKGAASHKIALPLNASPGQWQVTATDLPSGQRRSATFTVAASGKAPATPAANTAAPGAIQPGPWGATQRPPRETFTPVSSEFTFDLTTSMLKNPALLEGTSEGQPPRHWEGSLVSEESRPSKNPYAAMVHIEEDKSVTFMDAPTTKVTLGTTDESKIMVELRQFVDVSAVRGKKIRLTYYAFRESPATTREFWTRGVCLDAKGAPKGSFPNTSPKIPLGTWVRCSAEGMVDADATTFKMSLIGHFGDRPDTFWISGFHLEPID